MSTPHPAPTSFVTSNEDGIIYIRWLKNVQVDQELAAQAAAAVREASGGKPVPLLVDLGAMRSIDRAAREYFQHQGLTMTTAMAFVTRGALGKVIANFFIGLNRPAVPTRMFDDEMEAVAWLKAQR